MASHAGTVHRIPTTPRVLRPCAAVSDDDQAISAGARDIELFPPSRNKFYGSAHLGVLAEIYARTGRSDQAVRLLKQLLSTPAGGVVSTALLRVDPNWDATRLDPGFQKLLHNDAPLAEARSGVR